MTEQERIDEIKTLQAHFHNSVDITDPKSLAKWFIDHHYFSIGALAATAGVSRKIIRKWRKFAGIAGPKGQYNPIKNKPIVTTITINPPLPGQSWKDPVWLRDAYERNPDIKKISEIVGVHFITVWNTLKKLGIYKSKPIHPCDNLEWIKLNYVYNHNSAKECARLAGVSHNAMLNWISKHGVATHTLPQTNYSISHHKIIRVPLWLKVLAGKLQEHADIVEDVKLHSRGMTVHYKTKILELYFDTTYTQRLYHRTTDRIFKLTAENSQLEKQIPIHYRYPVDFGDLNYNHLIINRSDWNKASLIEQRIALHRFQLKQHDEGCERFGYPTDEIEKCLQHFVTSNPNRYIKNNIFNLYAGITRSWPIVFTYFNLRPELSNVFRRPWIFLRMLNKVTNGIRNITTETFLRYACAEYGIKAYSPVGYQAIFEKLGLRKGGTLFDLQPGMGHKAIACSLIGASYRTRPHNKRFNDANVYGDLDRHLKLDWDWYRGEKVDMLLADNDFRLVNVEYALDTYSNVAKRIVCYVKADLKDEYEKKFKPRSIIGIHATFAQELSYLFVW